MRPRFFLQACTCLLVELHGGTVSAQSRGAGQGAIFTVRLLLARGLQAGPSPTRRTASTGVRVALPSLAGVRVLVVDDEAEMRELVSAVLVQQQAAVTTASSAEAMDVVHEERPHVIVADVAMPGEDGHQLLQHMRGLAPQQGGQTPAVALSALAAPAEQQRALRSGFKVCVAKPVEPAELVSVVAELVASATTPDASVVG